MADSEIPATVPEGPAYRPGGKKQWRDAWAKLIGKLGDDDREFIAGLARRLTPEVAGKNADMLRAAVRIRDILSNVSGFYLVVNSQGGVSFYPFEKVTHAKSHGKRVAIIDGFVYVVNPDRFVRRTLYPIFGSRRYPRVTYYGLFYENDPEQMDFTHHALPDVTGSVVGSIINDKIIRDILNPETDLRPWLYIIVGALLGGMAVGLYFLSQKGG
jgi:hypothetical protein